jgi:hypothetical protein
MKTNLNKRDEFLVNLLQDLYEVEVCELGEPGYSLSENEKAALICDWNRIEEKCPNIYEYIDNNFMLLYSDEWIILEDGKCYRTMPDSYFWQPSIVIDCDQYIASETLNSYSDEEFLSFLERNDYLNNSKLAINLWGFEPRGVRLDEEEYYMFEDHREPETILSGLLKSDPDGKYYFVIDGVSQFGLDFSIYRI